MIERSFSSTPLTYYTYNNSPYGSAYGVRKDYSNVLGTILSPKTPIPNLFLTGQSLMLHGLHGVTMTAKFTCEEVMGRLKVEV
jgi:all-trans-retinol 13,14-reductase